MLVKEHVSYQDNMHNEVWSKQLIHTVTLQGPTVWRGNSAHCYLAARVGGEFGREWIPVCVAEPLCCAPETVTLLISYIPT